MVAWNCIRPLPKALISASISRTARGCNCDSFVYSLCAVHLGMLRRVAVIGGGIIGSLVVREFLRTVPDVHVMLFDRGQIGHGASQRSAGLHYPMGYTPRARRMSLDSQRYYADLKAQDAQIPLHPIDLTIVAPHRHFQTNKNNFLASATLIKRGSAPSEPLRLRQAFGTWSALGCHYAEVSELIRHLVLSLRGNFDLFEGCAVEEIRCSRAGADLLLRTGARVKVDKVVVAAGPWLRAPAWRALVEPLRLRVMSIVCAHVNLPPDESDCAKFFVLENAFLLPLPRQARWLLCFTWHGDDHDSDTEFVDSGMTEAQLDKARALLRRYLPAFAEACNSGWTFGDAFSISGEPEVRALGNSNQIIYAGAGSGSGYRLAPAIAAEVVDILSRDPSLPVQHPTARRPEEILVVDQNPDEHAFDNH